jgi:hypothetical protein
MKLCVPKGFKNIKQPKNRPGDRKKKKKVFFGVVVVVIPSAIVEFWNLFHFFYFFQRYCRRVMLFCVSLLPLRVVI